MFSLQPIRQLYCLCKTPVVLNTSCLEVQFKKSLIASTHVYGISTSNWRKKDVIAEPNKDSMIEVYKGSIANSIFRVKAFSLGTSVMGISLQPILLQRAMETDSSMAFMIGSSTFIAFFTFVTPLLLNFVTRKYVLSLQYSPTTESYTAKTYSFFLRNKYDKFKAEDIVIPDIPSMFTTFKANGRTYFVDKDSFLDISHYKKIMGYDKPLDLALHKHDTIKKE